MPLTNQARCKHLSLHIIKKFNGVNNQKKLPGIFKNPNGMSATQRSGTKHRGFIKPNEMNN
jgi:hypothetical protein